MLDHFVYWIDRKYATIYEIIAVNVQTCSDITQESKFGIQRYNL